MTECKKNNNSVLKRSRRNQWSFYCILCSRDAWVNKGNVHSILFAWSPELTCLFLQVLSRRRPHRVVSIQNKRDSSTLDESDMKLNFRSFKNINITIYFFRPQQLSFGNSSSKKRQWDVDKARGKSSRKKRLKAGTWNLLLFLFLIRCSLELSARQWFIILISWFNLEVSIWSFTYLAENVPSKSECKFSLLTRQDLPFLCLFTFPLLLQDKCYCIAGSHKNFPNHFLGVREAISWHDETVKRIIANFPFFKTTAGKISSRCQTGVQSSAVTLFCDVW